MPLSDETTVVSRIAIRDGLVDLASLRADPLWECDFATDNWHKRTPEFYAARAEAEAVLPAQREAAGIALRMALLQLAAELPEQRDALNRHDAEQICSWDDGCESVHQTSGEAIREWRTRLLVYVKKHPGDTLWWRVRPEIEARIPFGETAPRWRVYSRVVIGNVADTLIERLRRGETAPTRNMVADHLVTMAELNDMGWTLDENGDWARPGWAFHFGLGRMVKL